MMAADSTTAQAAELNFIVVVVVVVYLLLLSGVLELEIQNTECTTRSKLLRRLKQYYSLEMIQLTSTSSNKRNRGVGTNEIRYYQQQGRMYDDGED